MPLVDTVKSKANSILFWMGLVIFAASVSAGVIRSLTRNRELPPVGVEYTSELRSAFKQNGYRETLGWMQSAVQLDLDNDTIARELLLAAQQAGDTKTVVEALEKLVRLRPDDAEIRSELVSVLLAEGRVVEALGHAEVALKLNPMSAVAHCNLGAVLLGLDQKDAAAAAYRRALQLEPANEHARDALAFPLRGY